jgi:Na+-transporting methylmalonyl-CoA/oxaloacetate decarboxylase gamma subunit
VLRRFAMTAILVILVVLVCGCSQVKGAAAGVAKSAASHAEKAAANVVRRQICGRVQQVNVSARDKQVLAGLLPAANAAGLPPQITTVLHQIAASGNKPLGQSVKELRQACASPSP